MAQKPRIEEDLDSRFSDLRSSVKSWVRSIEKAREPQSKHSGDGRTGNSKNESNGTEATDRRGFGFLSL